MKEKNMSEIININGTEYNEEDFNQEQRYFLKQIRSCKIKAAQFQFELDQVKVAEQAFSNAFMISLETKKNEENSEKKNKTSLGGNDIRPPIGLGS
tara:strand:- start:399 stop:686 length:288 start_codon:yes stop_codon:yes gene_type:complete